MYMYCRIFEKKQPTSSLNTVHMYIQRYVYSMQQISISLLACCLLLVVCLLSVACCSWWCCCCCFCIVVVGGGGGAVVVDEVHTQPEVRVSAISACWIFQVVWVPAWRQLICIYYLYQLRTNSDKWGSLHCIHFILLFTFMFHQWRYRASATGDFSWQSCREFV